MKRVVHPINLVVITDNCTGFSIKNLRQDGSTEQSYNSQQFLFKIVIIYLLVHSKINVPRRGYNNRLTKCWSVV